MLNQTQIVSLPIRRLRLRIRVMHEAFVCNKMDCRFCYRPSQSVGPEAKRSVALVRKVAVTEPAVHISFMKDVLRPACH